MSKSLAKPKAKRDAPKTPTRKGKMTIRKLVKILNWAPLELLAGEKMEYDCDLKTLAVSVSVKRDECLYRSIPVMFMAFVIVVIGIVSSQHWSVFLAILAIYYVCFDYWQQRQLEKEVLIPYNAVFEQLESLMNIYGFGNKVGKNTSFETMKEITDHLLRQNALKILHYENLLGSKKTLNLLRESFHMRHCILSSFKLARPKREYFIFVPQDKSVAN